MDNDIDNKEWVNDYPTLKSVAKSNPFTVPDGFFSASEDQILSSVSILSSTPSNNEAFTVPANYFEDLQSNILSRVNIADALNEQQPFSVPENYFADMQAQISSRIAVEEAAKVPFTVPADYFETLNRNILNQTAGLEAVQRKGVIRKLVSTTAFRYASAACFALIAGAGIILIRQNSPQAVHDKTYLHQALSEIPNGDIENYLQLHMDASDTQSLIDKADNNDLNSVSTDDLKDYLSNN